MIKVLDKSIADKIAAGEVIERPVSIVKELVENSVDAGASAITVEIKNGGKSYIRVTDNGCGIPFEQVETAFLRHATSKISTAKDLNAINTLGFRGEALASICAVSRTELLTKTASSKAGGQLILHGGQCISKAQTGCPDGTTVIISDLFYNTPARLKFMKSDATESGMIIDFISQFALAFKDIQFRLINNGKILFSTAGDGNRLKSIIRIYSNVDSRALVPLEYEEDGVKVSGYISTPALSRTNRGTQIFFVNGRVVTSKVIDKGVSDGYKERLFEGRYPVVFLFIDIEPSKLDVNIHPNKRAVRFDDERLVEQIIARAIISALSVKEAMVNADRVMETQKLPFPSAAITSNSIETLPKETTKTEKKEILNKQEQVDIKELLSTRREKEKEESLKAVERIDSRQDDIIIEKPTHIPFDINSITVTGSVFGTYITAVDENSCYFIDQHAAHERVFYEKLVAQYESDEKLKQPIMIPLIIVVSAATAESFTEWGYLILKMGFTMELFGTDTLRVTEIPTFMTLSEAEDFINYFVENIGDSMDIKNSVIINKLIMKSCKSAVKANDWLKEEEISSLMNQLSKCVNPFSCPHGRPTFIKLTRHEIERLFKRV